MQTDAGKLTGT